MAASVFDFATLAREYDTYYDTLLGQRVDAVERRLVDHHLARLDTGPLLEIGCGTGHWTTHFARRVGPVTALDVSAQMLEVARGKHIPGAGFLQGDACHLACADASQQRIATITALEFVADQQRAVAEIARVLRPGGWLLIGCLNACSALGRSKHRSPIYRDAAFFTPESLARLLEDFGVPVVQGCVVMEDDDLLDAADDFDADRARRQGAFLVGSVRRR